MGLSIEKAGLLSTIQDMGRFGFQKDGVSVSGAMDAAAMRLSNILCGNEEGVPVAELTHPGPVIRFTEDHLIALTGADISATLNGKPLPLWRPFVAEKDSLLEFGKPQKGRFVYMAVAGGFDVPQLMGSASTFLSAGFGGYRGRALMKGDHIVCKKASKLSLRIQKSIFSRRDKTAGWAPAAALIPDYFNAPVVRAMKGPDYGLFSELAKRDFWEGRFAISNQSGRRGYQLEGPELPLLKSGQILSTAVTFGTVQAAPGKTIILGADRQTTGGYPVIAQIISADLPAFVQLQAGKTIRFQKVSLQEAHQALFRQEKNLVALRTAIQLKHS